MQVCSYLDHQITAAPRNSTSSRSLVLRKTRNQIRMISHLTNIVRTNIPKNRPNVRIRINKTRIPHPRHCPPQAQLLIIHTPPRHHPPHTLHQRACGLSLHRRVPSNQHRIRCPVNLHSNRMAWIPDEELAVVRGSRLGLRIRESWSSRLR